MTITHKPDFLPVNREDMARRGWDELDFICVTGDAYVDHPSFGHAIVSRLLESLGYRVGVIAQPDWRSKDDFEKLGRPRLGALVAAGNLDSMLSNFSTPRKRRTRDSYSPGGQPGRRPDRATLVYCNRIRELWKDVPLIVGGVEASLRRLAHYDYWSDDVRRSILVDCRGDLLIYGMAESQLTQIAERLAAGEPVTSLRNIPGTCWKTHNTADAPGALLLPSFEEVKKDKRAFADAYATFYREQNFASGRRLIQDQGPWHVVHNPPPAPLSAAFLDRIYALPYMRAAHHSYTEGVPALEEVRFGVVGHRGCFGECSFCAISVHQGREIQPRSVESIIAEARLITEMPDFKGYIHDIGGPTANFRNPPCARQFTRGLCQDRSCLYPKPCPQLKASHTAYLALLKQVRALPGVKKVFIRSGLRYDYILADGQGYEFLRELCTHHISGQLKIAPEHVSRAVLSRMRKPPVEVSERFINAFRAMNERIGKTQFLVPYLMSGHPGSGLNEAIELAKFCRDQRLRPEQVQEFTPTPGTPASCMWHTGIDPFTKEEVYVPRDREERDMQRALLQYWMPANRDLVKKALAKAKSNIQL